MSDDSRPTALILGGVSTVGRHLVAYLCGDEGEVPNSSNGNPDPLVKYLRIADRFSVQPATTYLDRAFRRCLEKDFVEYRQTNLSVASRVAEIFTPPKGITSFDYIFDLTGETRADRPEIIHIQQSYTLPLALARHAAKLPHQAYIRLVGPYYIQSNNIAGGYNERFAELSDKAKKEKKGGLFRSKEKGSDGLGPKPDDVRGRWWHESVRAQAVVPNLRYAVVRAAEIYGEAYMEGQVLARLVIAHIYKFKNNEEMKFLHNPDLRLHTVHVRDVPRALIKVAEWMAKVGREEADNIAGEELPSAWTWSTGKDGDQERQGMKQVADLSEPAARIRAPYFNLVDDNDTTQEKLAAACSQVFQVRYGFHNAMISSLVSSFNRTDFTHLVDDINEDHMEVWQDMMSHSRPVIVDSAISPFLTEDSFRKKAINLNGQKLRTITGWQPSVKEVGAKELRAQMEALQWAQLWPKL